ncbi:SH3 domain-containing protein [Devosia sp.]|uniref:SH3 domain-containing protein n=1 Tax=Devosia sp. TaxID=1871048 RepID=UPI003266444B
MKTIRVALTSILATVALLASAAMAMAAPGQITSNVNVRNGPGTQYGVVGVLPAGQMVDVSQCDSGWCYVSSNGGAGWVSATFLAKPGQAAPADPSVNFGIQIGPDGKPSINFGINQPQPQPLPQPQRPRPIPIPQPEPEDDLAQACFYSGTNFSGSSFCVEQGDTLNSLQGWNDRIRSVELFNGATVDICGDRNLVGVCQTLTRSKGRIANQLDRRVSSLEVY